MLPFDELARVPGARRIRKGTVLLREGDASAGEMYVLLFGEAGEYRNYGTAEELMTDSLAQGSFFGESLLFAGKAPHATVIAVTDVIILPLNRNNAAAVLSRYPDLSIEIISQMCRRYNDLNASYEKLVDFVRNNPVPVGGAQASEKQAPSRKSALFAEGHGSYTLPLTNSNEEYLYEQKCVCPLCGEKFQALSVITSKLRRESAEGEMRTRYKDIEPMYYEIITCPSCYYTSPDDRFLETSKRAASKVREAIEPYVSQIGEIKPGRNKDTFTVFAGYYLAMICAEVLLDNYRLHTASLWQKLGRVYEDCNDAKMAEFATRKSLEDYKFSYVNYNVPDKTAQQICMVIGDLNQRLGDLEEARTFYYAAKSNKGGTPVVTRQADARLEELKELMNRMKEQG